MRRMSKSNAKKRCAEIITKMYNLMGAEYATAKDYDAVRAIMQRIRNRAK
jgi:hypothetical protein